MQTKRLGREIQVRVIEQISSRGTFQKKQVSSREKNTEQTWGLGPSRMAALHRGGVAWRTISLWLAPELWLVWDSLLFRFTGTETSQMLFLEGLKLTLGGDFSFYRLSLWVNIASRGENYKVAGAPGNIRATALHRHSPRDVPALSLLASCRSYLAAALWFEVAVLLPRNVNTILESVQPLAVFCT